MAGFLRLFNGRSRLYFSSPFLGTAKTPNGPSSARVSFDERMSTDPAFARSFSASQLCPVIYAGAEARRPLSPIFCGFFLCSSHERGKVISRFSSVLYGQSALYAGQGWNALSRPGLKKALPDLPSSAGIVSPVVGWRSRISSAPGGRRPLNIPARPRHPGRIVLP